MRQEFRGEDAAPADRELTAKPDDRVSRSGGAEFPVTAEVLICRLRKAAWIAARWNGYSARYVRLLTSAVPFGGTGTSPLASPLFHQASAPRWYSSMMRRLLAPSQCGGPVAKPRSADTSRRWRSSSRPGLPWMWLPVLERRASRAV